ncbi:MAG: GHKL domain-containing protein [Lachnospiraceae bacterium]|nr:GHKL domain-containing protein [Lachnospiraceae bacterium]
MLLHPFQQFFLILLACGYSHNDFRKLSVGCVYRISVKLKQCDQNKCSDALVTISKSMILNQSIGEFEERLAGNQITLVSNVPEGDVYVWADNRYLWRVFDNLMNNIVKYAQPGTRAYVDMTQSEGTITFTFRNISKNELNISADELMERFVRGDASRNTEGNGLGLSIARSLTESMDGKMDLAIDGDLFKVILTFKAQ